LLGGIVDAKVEIGKGIVGNLDPVQAHAFVGARQMGRGVEASADPGGGEDRGQRGCRGAFAVGSGYEHGGKAAVRVAERRQQDANLVEREFAPWLAGAFVKLGDHGIELIDSRGVGHGKSSIEGAFRPV
jgi:hypothetical protein